jgi:hypothetical protein
MTVADVTKLRKTWHAAAVAQELAQTVADNAFNAAASGTTDDFPALGDSVADLAVAVDALATLWPAPVPSIQAPPATGKKF